MEGITTRQGDMRKNRGRVSRGHGGYRNTLVATDGVARRTQPGYEGTHDTRESGPNNVAAATEWDAPTPVSRRRWHPRPLCRAGLQPQPRSHGVGLATARGVAGFGRAR